HQRIRWVLSHERSISSALADGDVARFPHHFCCDWYRHAALDGYRRVAMVANQRGSVSDTSQTLGEGNGNPLCCRRGFGDSAFVRVRIVVAQFYGPCGRGYRDAVLA